MIHALNKRYQLTLWDAPDRSGLAMHVEFDDLEEARRAFEAHRLEGRFKTGLLMEWDKRLNAWFLVRQYP